ncbi:MULTISPECIES: helix-turn-helix domain-containing protein [Mycobacteriaceae]|uniref:helix-turn-helix domain-containing protein n=1 Tax=Mycobacteriaceae TaxID=1762 RepID=UPI0009DC3146|nr:MULTISPECIES: helix-turn-helix transcriptional regulator [Mycobacteriaceae]AXK75865.1 XRE family transcriptional regulator [Mycolicibacterium neoaurum]
MKGRLQQVVGHNLRQHRVQQGYSQEAFAERMGVHRTYFSSVERGERNLTLQTLEHIADFLGVDPVALLTPMLDEGQSSSPNSPRRIGHAGK